MVYRKLGRLVVIEITNMNKLVILFSKLESLLLSHALKHCNKCERLNYKGKTMKLKLLLAILFVTIYQTSIGQEISDKEVKESVIKEINSERANEIAISEQQITKSQITIDQLNIQSSQLKKNKDKIENLLKRIDALEDKNKAIQAKETSLYSSNYQTAVINLAFLESDLKPLNLFQSSRKFFTSLNSISNPMNYPEYKEWYMEFKDYINKQKNREIKLSVLNDMLTVTSDLTKETPLTGPLVGILFDGIAKFIGTLGRSKRKLREQSEKMMSLTMILGQYSNEIKLIENEWDEIDESLAELQALYNEYITYNLGLINESKSNYELNFVNETDGMKKLTYLNNLRDLANKKVISEKNGTPNNWKPTFYYEMEKVQALKIRFGEITKRIQQNFEEYSDLILRYEKSPLLKINMAELKEKLENLKENFSESFNPENYIKNANTMYKID